MADHTPLGAVASFAGTTISSMTNVASIGYPSIDKKPVEAYAQVLGQVMPVDLLNGTAAPQQQTVTVQVLLRAADGTTDPAAAWQEVAAAYRALEGLPESGTLVINLSAGGGGTASCTARRKPITQKIEPKNARHIVAELNFVPLTPWT